eukprot:TRINITY_DN772_c0_g1_i1.p1 TRINITY_DN772_c0_g1~~TRINITY_DN772_c0_g1_i1.p1  ORF type:complete len:279 (+),score=79.15 TRINITY_DN772_c0_g1_i1:59-895(+)
MNKIAFLGGGNMCEAIIKGILYSKSLSASDITVSDISEERLQLFNKLGVNTTMDNEELVRNCEVLVFAVKPQIAQKVILPIRDCFNSNQVLVSIMAGISIEFLEKIVGNDKKIIRVMPNTPMLSLQGALGYYGNRLTTKNECKEVIDILFKGCAPVIFGLESEDLINSVIAVSGSGPAYVFNLIDCMIQGGIKEGLTREQAQKLAIQTIIGAGSLAKSSLELNITPVELKRKVTSPNGTTQEALSVMSNNNWETITQNAVRAAAERGRELERNLMSKL